MRFNASRPFAGSQTKRAVERAFTSISCHLTFFHATRPELVFDTAEQGWGLFLRLQDQLTGLTRAECGLDLWFADEPWRSVLRPFNAEVQLLFEQVGLARTGR